MMQVVARSRPSEDRSFMRKATPGWCWEGTRRQASRNSRCANRRRPGSRMSSSGAA